MGWEAESGPRAAKGWPGAGRGPLTEVKGPPQAGLLMRSLFPSVVSSVSQYLLNFLCFLDIFFVNF